MSTLEKDAGETQRTPDTLDDHELTVLSAHATEQTYQKNVVVVNEGDQSNTIFIILSGRVKVFLRNAEGREMVINVLGPREYFGEMVIDEGSRSASVATLETSRFMIITKTDFKALVISEPDFALKLITRLMQRVRVLTDNIRSLALLDVYGRVARTLLDMAEMEGEKKVIRNKVSRQDLAKVVGASREMVSRVMKDLEERGMIETQENGSVVIKEQLTQS